METAEQNEAYFLKIRDILHFYFYNWKPTDIPFKSPFFDYFILFQYSVVFADLPLLPIPEHLTFNPYFAALRCLSFFSSNSIFNLFPHKQTILLFSGSQQRILRENQSEISIWLEDLCKSYVVYPKISNFDDPLNDEVPIKLTNTPNLPAYFLQFCPRHVNHRYYFP